LIDDAHTVVPTRVRRLQPKSNLAGFPDAFALRIDSECTLNVADCVAAAEWLLTACRGCVCVSACLCVCVCLCVCAPLCGCLGVWMSGRLGVWVSGCLGVWVSGCLGVWVSGCLGVWVSECCVRACVCVLCARVAVLPILCPALLMVAPDSQGKVRSCVSVATSPLLSLRRRGR
jgi:hypothetical protein